MVEMGYEVEKLAFYAISTNKTFPLPTPNEQDKKNFKILFWNLEDLILNNPLLSM
jgi:hypothetical protein